MSREFQWLRQNFINVKFLYPRGAKDLQSHDRVEYTVGKKIKYHYLEVPHNIHLTLTYFLHKIVQFEEGAGFNL